MIIFTDHALLKLRQRNIPKRFVLQTLASFDEESPSHSNRHIRYKRFKKLLMAVVFKEERGDIIVLTAHWVDKVK